MRKTVVILLIILLGIMPVVCAPVLALEEDDSVLIEQQLTPSSLVEAGSAVLSYTIRNISPYEILNFKIISGTTTVAQYAGSIPGGRIASLGNIQLSFTEETIGKPQVYHASWVQNGRQIIRELAPFTVNRLTPIPDLYIKCEASAETAENGAAVQFTYVLRNIGNVTLRNLVMRDDELEINQHYELLPPNEEITFTAEKSLSNTIIAHPFVTFVSAGQQQTAEGNTVRVLINKKGLQISLSADRLLAEEADVVTLTYTVTNTHTKSIENIVVYDGALGNIGTIAELKANASETLQFAFHPSQTVNLLFRAEGRDSAGEVFPAVSEYITINRVSIASALDLKVEATTNYNTYQPNPGVIDFLVTITNLGGLPAQNVLVENMETKATYSFLTLTVGEDKVFNIPIEIKESGGVRFRVTAYDSTGKVYTYVTEPIYITIGAEDRNDAGLNILSLLDIQKLLESFDYYGLFLKTLTLLAVLGGLILILVLARSVIAAIRGHF